MQFRTSTRGAAAWRNSVLVTVAVAFCGLSGGAAQAFPKFSTKEKKPCSYCHVKAAGGGKRTAAGTYYQTHGLSFAGYTPVAAAAAVAKKPTGGAAKPGAKKPAPKKPAKKK